MKYILFGEETRVDTSDWETCPDCGVKKGNPHRDGCDWEECPTCHGQRLSCDCDAEDPIAKVQIEGLGSMLLDVQQDCIKLRKALENIRTRILQKEERTELEREILRISTRSLDTAGTRSRETGLPYVWQQRYFYQQTP